MAGSKDPAVFVWGADLAAERDSGECWLPTLSEIPPKAVASLMYVIAFGELVAKQRSDRA